MSKIAILGTGSWASGLATVLTDNKHEVLLYGISQDEIEDINNNHQNSKFFKDVDLNKEIRATNNLDLALENADYVLVTLPSQFIREVLTEVNSKLKRKITIINASKGFDLTTNQRLSDTIRTCVDIERRNEIVSIIGPSHAEEVVIRLYTTVCAVSIDHDTAKDVQNLFSNEYFRVYTLEDEIGAEYGVALKNVMAVASGVLSGLGYGDNTRAGLITRGLAEMVRYGVAKGGKPETFLGLTGVGDLIVTCTSPHSRNFQAGYEIGKSNDVENFMKTNKKTCEGIRSCKVIYEDAQSYPELKMPIVEAIYDVLYNHHEPSSVIKRLMTRELKPE